MELATSKGESIALMARSIVVGKQALKLKAYI